MSSFTPQSPVTYGTAKAVTVAMIEAVGGAKRAAHVLRVHESRVYAAASVNEPTKFLSFEQMRVLADVSPDAAAVLAEDAAQFAGGVFMSVASAKGSLLDLTALSAKEHGEVMSRAILMCSDKPNPGARPADVLKEIDDELRVLCALRARVGEMV